MKALNLVDINKSDVKYIISKFPDGQQDVTITGLEVHETQEWGAYLRNFSVQIRARLDNFRDLELIVCATRALQNLRVKEIHLYIPHVLGARSDRKFQEGGTRYLSQVLAPIVNMLEFETVTCIDVHSDVAENVINRLQVISNIELVRWALKDIYKTSVHPDDYVLFAPDAGASKKIYKVAEALGSPDVVICEKHRNVPSGKLTKVRVPDFDRTKDVIIVDDIFDYGGTFVNISKELTVMGYEGNKYLIVTHSIQEEGLKNTLKYFDCIYTTNSVRDFNIENVKQLDVL